MSIRLELSKQSACMGRQHVQKCFATVEDTREPPAERYLELEEPKEWMCNFKNSG